MSIQLNKFQEKTLFEMVQGKTSVQIAKEMGKSLAIIAYHRKKFINTGLIEVIEGKAHRTSINYVVVPDGKLIGNHWRNQFDSGWLSKKKE